jgi:hypothetical protein
MQCSFFVQLVAGILIMGLAGKMPPSRDNFRCRVLIDRSIEFLFAYDVLKDFLVRTGYQVTENRATLDAGILQRYDIIVLQQLTTPLQFSDAVINSVEKWVQAGGRLVLIGHARQWDITNRGGPHTQMEFPLNRVATRFGFRFLPDAQGEFPLYYRKHPVTEGCAQLSRDTYDPRARIFGSGWMDAFGVGLTDIPPGAEEIIVDSKGRSVMAIKRVGKGEVLVFTGKRTLWGLTRHPDPQSDEVVQQLVSNLFAYLSREAKPHASEPPVPQLIPPDRELRVGQLKVIYTEPLKERAEFLAKEYPRLYHEMECLFGVPPMRSIDIEALPSAAGGWTAGNLIGIGALGKADDVLAIFLWEMTNAWDLPEAHGWVEVWAEFTSYLLRERLNIYSPARRTQDMLSAFKDLLAADPDLKRIDVSKASPDENSHRLKVKKVALMLLRLHQRYGDEFFQRLLRIHRAQYKSEESISIDDLITEMSLAAREDLFPWFAGFGTTVCPQPIDFRDADDWLARYREMVGGKVEK